MDMMNWMIQTSAPGSLPVVFSEYLLNDMGIFMRREQRMPKKEPLNAITGFRVGYKAVAGTDYRIAHLDRNAILWHKITSVSEDDNGLISVCGNTSDVIAISCTPENRDAVSRFISIKRQEHPAVAEADYAAAAWICWRDDDDWGDAETLLDMVNEGLNTERFIEPEVLKETEITVAHEYSIPPVPPKPAAPSRPKFCRNCGESLPSDGNFCENCGNSIL